MEVSVGEYALCSALMRLEGNTENEDILKDVQAALVQGVDLAKDLPLEYDDRVEEGDSALLVAVSFTALGIVRLLIDAGAKARNATEAYSMCYQCQTNNDVEMLRCLLNRGAVDILPGPDVAYFMLGLCHEVVTVDLLRVCLEFVASRRDYLSKVLAYTDYNGKTMLHMAVCSFEPTNIAQRRSLWDLLRSYGHSRRAPVVKLLIEFGANVLQTDNAGHTPAYLAKDLMYPDPEVNDILEEALLDIKKLEAFSMGSHPRLGDASMMRRIDPEVLRMIQQEYGRRG
jgi:ankyrin repeat protein